ncbi:MAG: glucokinase [Halioglobus sp.]|nr:glucokinase [Halioglobus sp.]
MDSILSGPSRLVADVGGTNSRLALFDPQTNELRAQRNYRNRDYAHFEDIVDAWLLALTEPPPIHGCLAVAAPPLGDRVSMLNIDWSFSCRELATRFGLIELRCINDFQGNAYALPYLTKQDLISIHSGGSGAGIGKLATLGPGTGLGGATLTLSGDVPVACASEPGHMGLAASTALELELFRYLQPQYGEVHAELLLSGPGLQRLYRSLADIQEWDKPTLTPEEISTQAMAGRCKLCELTLNTFCDLLGSAAGDYVLANGAYGGLYLAGGIIPGMVEFLAASHFVQRFQEKGNMQPHLNQVALYAITCETTGLIGAAHTPL